MTNPDTFTMVFLMLAIWAGLSGFFIIGELAIRLYYKIADNHNRRKQ